MRSGGSYRVGKDGKRTVAEEPTKDHPEGNRARPSEEAKAAPKGKAQGDDAPKGK